MRRKWLIKSQIEKKTPVTKYDNKSYNFKLITKSNSN